MATLTLWHLSTDSKVKTQELKIMVRMYHNYFLHCVGRSWNHLSENYACGKRSSSGKIYDAMSQILH